MHESILSTVGNTPLVKLNRLFRSSGFNLYAKLEAFNPGGSIKDRAALGIVKHALAHGLIKPGDTVIESSSGNMGIGLAQVCAYYGLRFICVVDPKTTRTNLEILRAFGAIIDLVSTPDPQTGEFLQARIDRVQTLLQTIDHSFWPDQYRNPGNPLAHHRTMQEISVALDGKIDLLFCATSTCGTMRGCAEYVRAHKMSTKVYAVDAVGSVIFGGPFARRLIPGHGAAVKPALYQPDLADECIHVTDVQCVIGCRRLAQEEAILAGGSSGAVIMAVEAVKHLIPENANCVAILPDRGERYLDTIFSNEWVGRHFGDLSYPPADYAKDRQPAWLSI
ncbi:MAG TPA: 2,3-diaminopropionate biosynthesis protein SbnA [Blastocatellia bacterium]|nr:2,3-diaminopropionate biosynthesis protein SbnA [Blastocatellia bacterium]